MAESDDPPREPSAGTDEAGEDSLPGSTQELATVAEPDDPLRVAVTDTLEPPSEPVATVAESDDPPRESSAETDEAAEKYVANLARSSPEPIPGERAKHFIGADQEIQFGSTGEDFPPGSTQEFATVAEPDDPLKVPSAEAEARTGAGTEPPGKEPPAAEPGKKPGDDAGEPASGAAPTAAGKDDAAPTATKPEKKPEPAAVASAEDRPATGAEPSGEDRTATPTAEPVSGAAPTAAGKDDAPPPTTEPEKKPEPAAGPSTEDRPATGAEPPGEDRTATPATEPMKKADDDIGELLSSVAPAVRKDDAPRPTTGPVKKPEPAAAPAEDRTAPGAEPAPETGPETPGGTAGKGAAEAAGAKTGASGSLGNASAPRETITIRDLLAGTVEFDENDVFYVHAVTPGDDQGLWGILQEAVTGSFARGVRLTLGERTDTYRVAVPEHADELLDDRSSSPLGLMIHRKSQQTIVYNRRLGRLTQDPDVTLYPGNELIIVGFKPEELIRLYKHFAHADGG